jgi:CRISPR-associated protein Csb1
MSMPPYNQSGKTLQRQFQRIDGYNRNATVLFELCPTALVFGMWDSTGPRGGLGAKFARAMVSEIVGIQAVTGVKTSSRIDPAQILKNAGPIFRTADGGWTLDQDAAQKADGGKLVLFKQSKGKDVLWDPKKDKDKIPDQGRPSVANHGNVTPDIDYRRDQYRNPIRDENGNPIPIGGVTLTKALQTTVLSLPALRRLRFPINGKNDPKVNQAARTVLAALGLCAATLFQEQGCDLRSRCQLIPVNAYQWELIGKPGEDPKPLTISTETAIGVYAATVAEARNVCLPWMEEELKLTPSPELVALVKKSQELAAKVGVEEEGE